MDLDEARQIKGIELEHVGEDYCKYSFLDADDERIEVEITGYAVHLINCLGMALKKKSFEKAIL